MSECAEHRGTRDASSIQGVLECVQTRGTRKVFLVQHRGPNIIECVDIMQVHIGTSYSWDRIVREGVLLVDGL